MLKLKIRPGQKIIIGENVSISVVLDEARKLALHIDAPDTLRIERKEIGAAEIPRQN